MSYLPSLTVQAIHRETISECIFLNHPSFDYNLTARHPAVAHVDLPLSVGALSDADPPAARPGIVEQHLGAKEEATREITI